MSRILFFLLIAFVVYGIFRPFLQPKDEPVIEEVVKPVEVKPSHNVDLPDFASYASVKQKKREFFSFLSPNIDAANTRISQQREKLMTLKAKGVFTLDSDEIQWLNTLAKSYSVKVSDIEQQVAQLEMRVDIIPRELVLMQAANESAWGTSRFAKLGLNFFGQWCYKKGCGFVPLHRNEDAAHEVAGFQNVQQGVDSYFRNLNTHNAYKLLREIRAQLRSSGAEVRAEALATGLQSYSERGDAYIEDLLEMIEYNRPLMEG